MSDLAFASATALSVMLADRKISATELFDHIAARVDAHNGTLNAIVTQDRDTARLQALAADAALARGARTGPLHGLPVTVKDAYEVAGLPSTGGHPQLKNHVPARDAAPVARLRCAGAIIFGKTNVPFLSGDFQAHNDIYGTTNNPWDVTRTSGGSSGGAAAAVAAGLSAFETGSDIGGSIRTPAHFCGIFGFKPSFGIVPKRGHIPPMPGGLAESELSVAGPLARSAADLELLLDILAGAPDEDPAWHLALPPARRTTAAGLRIALWAEDPFTETDNETSGLIEQAARALEREGAVIDASARPAFSFARAFSAYARLMHAIIANDFPPKIRDRLIARAASAELDDTSHEALQALGAAMSYADRLELGREQAQIMAHWAAFFRDYDAVLCPVAPVPAFPHDHRAMSERRIDVNGRERPYLDLIHWAGLATGSHLPAAVAPVGRTAAGLPVGVQIIGPHLEDRTPLAVAAMLERTLGGFVAPALFS